MTDPFLLAMLGLGGMFVLIALHVPIGVAMGIAGVVGVSVFVTPDAAMSLFAIESVSAIANPGLGIIAVFLLMGSFANVAGLSADIFRLAYALIGHWRGGLAMATIAGCAGFGAVCGSSVATTATMGRIALPEMVARNYAPSFASGSIASGGTLGMLIPPSVIMVLYGILTEQFVIALFAAAILPGLIAVAFYFVAILVTVTLKPGIAPPGPKMAWAERAQVFRESWRVLVLAIAVGVGIYSGIFTVTEAASVGASIAFFFALSSGNLTLKKFFEVLLETAGNTCLIFTILIGANIFSYFISMTQAPGEIIGFIRAAELSPLVVILILMVVYLILGSIFDTVASMVITLPFVFPLILEMGYSPIWWGVMMVMVMEVGMITPPIGINVFVLHGVARTLSLRQIYAGITPFFIADLVRLAIVALFPAIALAIPAWLGFIRW